jgi:uncharacterized protein
MSFDHSQAAKLVGAESGPITAPDKISKSDIRHFCELLGDPDPSYAEKIKRGEKTAPPAMLMAWSMPRLWPPKQESTEPHEKVFALLGAAGYAGALTIAMEQEFLRPVRIGDRLRFKVKVEDVSKTEEQTKHGKGHLVKLLYTFLDGAGAVVSRQKCTVLKFRTLAAGS